MKFADVIKSERELRGVVGEPMARSLRKEIAHLDANCRAFIARSPFMLVASCDAQGRMDVSPKGDPAGFVQVLDERTLAIPDRPGNQRADTFTNVLQNPRVGLLFLIPGMGHCSGVGTVSPSTRAGGRRPVRTIEPPCQPRGNLQGATFAGPRSPMAVSFIIPDWRPRPRGATLLRPEGLPVARVPEASPQALPRQGVGWDVGMGGKFFVEHGGGQMCASRA